MSEIVLQLLHSATAALLHHERAWVSIRLPLRFTREMCLVGLRVHSNIPKSEMSALTVFTIRFTEKLMVEPSATVGLGLNSDVSHDSLEWFR